jgi:ribose/xylose/arabinose/galactoside ABC-type transport system permease subunit
MNSNNPWIGIVLIAIGVASIFGFEHYHITQGAVPMMIITLGIAVVQGWTHVQTVKTLNATKEDLVVLKNSIRPKADDETDPGMKLNIPPYNTKK